MIICFGNRALLNSRRPAPESLCAVDVPESCAHRGTLYLPSHGGQNIKSLVTIQDDSIASEEKLERDVLNFQLTACFVISITFPGSPA